jgi:hypothetical protein
MSIRPPAGSEIRQLIGALADPNPVTRESALARLAVMGPRAIEHLLREYPAASSDLRPGILRALETAADPRVLPIAREALSPQSTATHFAAIGVLRALLTSTRADAASGALDVLVATALDATRSAPLRIAASEALRDAPPDVRDPIHARLAIDSDPEVRAKAAGPHRAARGDHREVWTDAVGGSLPPSVAAMKEALNACRASARLTELQHLVDHLRAREQREVDASRREEWRAVRGAVHQALAARHSRLALYDLRDSLLGSERLPVAFVAALEDIGDASCLEPLAAAYDASSRSSDTWWREHLATAFRSIVQREGLTRRHAAVKRTMARWPEAAADLISRT